MRGASSLQLEYSAQCIVYSEAEGALRCALYAVRCTSAQVCSIMSRGELELSVPALYGGSVCGEFVGVTTGM